MSLIDTTDFYAVISLIDEGRQLLEQYIYMNITAHKNMICR